MLSFVLAAFNWTSPLWQCKSGRFYYVLNPHNTSQGRQPSAASPGAGSLELAAPACAEPRRRLASLIGAFNWLF